MRIQSIIKRSKGTHITLGDTTYHFVPDEDGRHVADVDDATHISRLLAIPDGFRSLDAPLDGPLLQVPDGFFFIVRGPQDLRAFHQWVCCIPDLDDDVEEQVLLIDKIAVGEASLGGYALPTDFEVPPTPSLPGVADTPPTSGPSPQTSADNSILPQIHDQQSEGSADDGDTLGAGDGGADAAGGVGAGNSDGGDVEEPKEQAPAIETDGTDQRPVAVELDREGLAKEYDELFGHRPNGKWKAEKIKEVIDEKKAQG